MNADFYVKIREVAVSAKGARKKVASFLLQYPQEVAFMTIERLAESCGVSAGMVSRTVREIGFNGFSDMQNRIRAMVRKNISPTVRFKRAGRRKMILRDTVRFEMKNLASILRLNSEQTIQNAIDLICQAPAVHVVGLRGSYVLAFSLAMWLDRIRENVFLMEFGAGMLVEQVKRFAPGDLVIIISFPRYVRESLLMAQEAKIAECALLAITDSFASPLTMQADLALLAPFESASFFNSPVAAYGLVSTLTAAVAQRLGDRSVSELERCDAIQNRWKQLFSRDDSWQVNLPAEG